MSYAVRKDGKGWRAVASNADIDQETEIWQKLEPDLVEINPLILQILALESTITPRRIREAVLGQENPEGWLANVEAQIVQLREQLT